MKEILLYDAARRPPDWTSTMQQCEVAVILTDARSGAAVTAQGQKLTLPGTCLVFDSRADAERYCGEQVVKVPSIRCDIYDRAGLAAPPLKTFVSEQYRKQFEKERDPRHLVVIGAGCLIASLPFFYSYVVGDRISVFAPIVAINLMVLSLRFFYRAYGVHHASNQNRESNRQKNQ